MRIIKRFILVCALLPGLGYSKNFDLRPFGIELGVTSISDLSSNFSTAKAGHSSTDWVAHYEVDITTLPFDLEFSRPDLHDLSLTVDGIGVVISAHLIFREYPIHRLVHRLGELFECEPLVVEGFENYSGECTKGKNSFLTYHDSDSGWSHVVFTVERPKAGRKPRVD